MRETVTPGAHPLVERHIRLGGRLFADVNGERRRVEGIFVNAEGQAWAGDIVPALHTLFWVETWFDGGIGQSVPAPPNWKDHMAIEICIFLGEQGGG
jgi:hypothetical protein